MQHTTKMVMVPQDIYSNLISKQEQTYSPLVGQLSNLDQELTSIMGNPNLSTDAKYNLYQQTFTRFQHLKNRQFPQPEMTIAQGNAVPLMAPVKNEFPAAPQDLLDGLPKTVRGKGRLLLNHLKNNQDIQWLPNGQLIGKDGQAIVGSNLIDLVHYVTRNRPNAKPPSGAQEFLKMLQQSHVPKEALNNSQLKEEQEEEKYTTPPPSFGTLYKPNQSPRKNVPKTSRRKELNNTSPYSISTKRTRNKPERYGVWEPI